MVFLGVFVNMVIFLNGLRALKKLFVLAAPFHVLSTGFPILLLFSFLKSNVEVMKYFIIFYF